MKERPSRGASAQSPDHPAGWWLASDGKWYPPTPTTWKHPRPVDGAPYCKQAVIALALSLLGVAIIPSVALFGPDVFGASALAAVGAIAFSRNARRRIRAANGALRGYKLALTARILSIIHVTLMVLFLLLVAAWAVLYTVSCNQNSNNCL